MVFSSIVFLFFFFPLFILLYNLVPQRFITFRNFVILAFSALFYIWGEPHSFPLLCIFIFISWIGGIILDLTSNKFWKKYLLGLLVILSLMPLVWYKYASFIVVNINSILGKYNFSEIILDRKIVMPIGISFFTFHIISYLVDIYRGKAKCSKNIINYATYIIMFPQLVAGPIVRYSTVDKQIEKRRVKLDDFIYGIKRFCIGLFKKILIANIVAVPADKIFALPPDQLSTQLIWCAIISYTLQIYFDFSAYSDMAIGLARMMGFRFLENFNRPYLALDIKDFWRRWHISLSSWFRDYVYIPLGGNKVSDLRIFINLWIVFLLCGLWHGANWTFIFWGFFHGSFLVFERIYGGLLDKLPKILRRVYLLLIVTIGWVFFRADTFTQATGYLELMFVKLNLNSIRSIFEFYSPYRLFIFGLAILIVFMIPQRIIYKIYRFCVRNNKKIYFEIGYLAITIILFFLSYAHLVNGAYNPFIYFRF